MSTQISQDAFFEEANTRCTPAKLQALKNLLPYLELWTVLELKYAQGDTHRAVSASIARRDEGRTLVFGSYANGRAWCQYRTELPEWVTEEQKARITDAYERFRTATGGDPGKAWQEYNIDELPLFDLENAIQTLSESLARELC